MSDYALNSGVSAPPSSRPHMDSKPHVAGALAFFAVLLAGLGFAAFSIATDIGNVGETNIAIGAFVLLGLALLIALGFEFVNGFHDTANAVATVIYTHRCRRWWLWSGPGCATWRACWSPPARSRSPWSRCCRWS